MHTVRGAQARLRGLCDMPSARRPLCSIRPDGQRPSPKAPASSPARNGSHAVRARHIISVPVQRMTYYTPPAGRACHALPRHNKRAARLTSHRNKHTALSRRPNAPLHKKKAASHGDPSRTDPLPGQIHIAPRLNPALNRCPDGLEAAPAALALHHARYVIGQRARLHATPEHRQHFVRQVGIYRRIREQLQRRLHVTSRRNAI